MSINSKDFSDTEYFLDKFFNNTNKKEEVRNDLAKFRLCQDIFSQVRILFFFGWPQTNKAVSP
jgi:hypothetical protein